MESFYAQNFQGVDFRKHPELYRIGRGEQGVLLVEPYKTELLPLWRFRTPEIALISANAIYTRFLQYKRENDFVGMDMARKFLQMGFTRARRYANHASGRKYKKGTRVELPQNFDPIKAASARIFYDFFVKACNDRQYRALRLHHKIKSEFGAFTMENPQ